MDLKKLAVGILMTLIVIIIIFQGFSAMEPALTNASDSVVYNDNCSEYTDTEGVAYWFNKTDLNCYNSTDGTAPVSWGSASFTTLPLTSLFSTSGMVFIILMSGLLITAIVIVMRRLKK